MVATYEIWRLGTASKSEGAGMDTSAVERRGKSDRGKSVDRRRNLREVDVGELDGVAELLFSVGGRCRQEETELDGEISTAGEKLLENWWREFGLRKNLGRGRSLLILRLRKVSR